MSTATATARPKQARKPVPRFLTPLGDSVFRIQVGKTWDNYSISPVPCDFGGIGFSVLALTLERDAPLYHVHISRPGVGTWDCIAGTKGTRCKHRDGILKLIELGKLPGPKPATQLDYQFNNA